MKLFHRSWRFLTVAVIFAVTLFAAQPILAAQGGTLSGTSLNAAGCYVDVSAVVQDAGFYAINMWDDGTFRAGAGAQVEAGGTLIVRLGIGDVILQGASGIGLYLENGVGAAATTTFDSNGSAQLWSDTVGTDCKNSGATFGATVISAGSGGCLNPRPDDAVVYSVPNGAPIYYAASKDTLTNITLPPGTWYITEFGKDYAKVWIACSSPQVYIPIGAVSR